MVNPHPSFVWDVNDLMCLISYRQRETWDSKASVLLLKYYRQQFGQIDMWLSPPAGEESNDFYVLKCSDLLFIMFMEQ